MKSCCEQEKGYANTFKYGGSISVTGIGVQCLIPGLSFSFLGIFEGGVKVGVTLGGEFGGSGYDGKCVARCKLVR